MDAILANPPPFPNGEPPPPMSRRTLRRWLRQVRETGDGDVLTALEPKVRSDRGASKTIPPELLAEALALRERAPRLSVRRILERITHPARDRVSRRTLSRAFEEAGYDRRDKRRRIKDRSRGTLPTVDWDLELWEADFPNSVWQMDSTPCIWLGKTPFRERPVRLQRLSIVDDHSRLVTGGGYSERLRVVDLLPFLIAAIASFGCPSVLYLDQAKVHRSRIITEGIARLGGTVILGTAGHAPGHGKIERLHQIQEDTLVQDLHLSPVHTVAAANQAYELWRERYALEIHGETKEAPLSRWQRIEGNARIPSEEALRWAFRGDARRTVSNVGIIEWDGQRYEAPPSHRRSQPYRVEIRFDLLDPSCIWIEDPDGSRHPCPLHERRTHTQRRRKKGQDHGSGLSFRRLLDDDGAVSAGDRPTE